MEQNKKQAYQKPQIKIPKFRHLHYRKRGFLGGSAVFDGGFLFSFFAFLRCIFAF